MSEKETRQLRDLYSVGPATVRDLKTLGISMIAWADCRGNAATPA